jgi:hypothetical protein
MVVPSSAERVWSSVYEQLRSLHLGHANIVDTAPVLRSVALERRRTSCPSPSNTCGRMEEGHVGDQLDVEPPRRMRPNRSILPLEYPALL